MAPASSNQKRKRGAPTATGPRDASRRATGSSWTDREAEAPVDDARPEETTGAEDNENSTPDEPGRRGRPKRGNSVTAHVEGDAARNGMRRSKRERRSADDNPWWISAPHGAAEQQDEPGDSSARPEKMRRISLTTDGTALRKQRMRSQRTDEGPTPTRADPTTPPLHTISRAARLAETSPRPTSEPRRRGRPRKSDMPPTTGEEAPEVEEPPTPRQRGRSRPSNVSRTRQTPPTNRSAVSLATGPQGPKGVIMDNKSALTAARRRASGHMLSEGANLSGDEMDDDLEASLPPVPKYQHLEPQTRQISRSAIKDKWTPLDGASIDVISTILSDTSRPVLLRLRDRELRHQHGRNILRIFAGRLRSKLRKGLPFPPPAATRVAGSRGDRTDAGGGHIEELKFESIVDSIETLETMLDPLLHSLALLEKEKAKEETALEKDYETLRTLESNARAEARGWRERMKKAHALAAEPIKQDGVAPELDGGGGEGLALSTRKDSPLPGLFYNTQDEELLSMSQQIASHMESIQKNVQPVREILPAIGRSRAALQGVLQTHLSPQQLAKVLIG